jgi:hypothetical protein
VDNQTLTYVIIALAAVAVLIIVLVAAQKRARQRRLELQRRFGPEYERTVQELGSPARADRELAQRARRVERVQFRELGVEDRARFSQEWTRIQAQFVDDPAVAVAGAAELIEDVMRARGYPSKEFEQRVADLSVVHPDMVQHYRAAHSLAESSRSGRINTEELRQAVVHYRFLFSELLSETRNDVHAA